MNDAVSTEEGSLVTSQSGAIAAVASVAPSAGQAAAAPHLLVDFAHVIEGRLLVYGWILGLAGQVASAKVCYGESTHDLLAKAIRVPRPDVSGHFSLKASVHDHEHGFFLVVEPDAADLRRTFLKLSLAFHSGETAESTWPVGRGAPPVIEFFKQNRSALIPLLSGPRASDLESIQDLLFGVLPPALAAELPAVTSQRCVLDVELCGILENRLLLVCGSIDDPQRNLTSVKLKVGSLELDFFAGIVFDPYPAVERGSAKRFTYMFRLAVPNPGSSDAVFTLLAGAERTRVRRALHSDAAEARNAFVAALNRFGPDEAITLIEAIVRLLGDTPADRALHEFLAMQHTRAVERLPLSIDTAARRFFLDRVVPVASSGVFLNGWCDLDAGSLGVLACHNGFTKVGIDDRWIRYPRPDVVAYLDKSGVKARNYDQGFFCYCELQTSGAPYFISVTTEEGMVRRLRMPPLGDDIPPPIERVRALLTAFSTNSPILRPLLDGHVGPAVRATWEGRERLSSDLTLERFGRQPPSPQLSIIVPLYGRFDLAEHQLALFADDAQFAELELIYFVDDPAIYEEFRLQCRELCELYRVPLTLAYAGMNLGFAGANNAAAHIARGRHLLLMNSDVFPKCNGWTGELLRIYGTLEDPGLLGVKLLFEDGSVQHAGMSFRRHAPWSDLWINYHPYKGQSPHGLCGVREVDAVTAACVLVDASLYREVGGLSEDYIIGDFEDSDLCFRVALAGRRNYVALDVELYHLERQSQDRIGDSQWRTNLTVYNCWQHDRRWASSIAKRHRDGERQGPPS